MEDKHTYNLSEAVKTYYTIEPLKTDLSKMVAGKVFTKKEDKRLVVDRALIAAAVCLIVGGTVWCISLLLNVSLIIICSVVLIFIIYFGLSLKEMDLFSKNIASLSHYD